MRRFRKTYAFGLSAAMVMAMLTTGNISYAAGKVEKEETVYVTQDSDGSVSEITVSDCLKNVGKNDVKDKSNLTNIENTKGDETYEQGEGDAITWKGNGEDIYYEGETSDKPPISVSFTYQLDGKEMKAEDLAGKSGKLMITAEYKNEASYKDSLNGKEEELYVPFLMASVVVLPQDHFENVEVSQGKLVKEGDDQIAIAYAVPGLTKSLNLSGDMKKNLEDDLKDSITITADVTEFELDSIYTIATSDIFSEIDLDEDSSMDDLEEALDGLSDATDELISGSSQLSDGIGTFHKSFSKYADGVKKLNKGAKSLASGAKTLADSIGTLATGTNSYVNGAKSFAEGVTGYIVGEKAISQINDALAPNAATLTTAGKSVAEGVTAYTDATAAADKQAASVATGTAETATALAGVDYSGIIAVLEASKQKAATEEEKTAIDAYIAQLKGVSETAAKAATTAQSAAVVSGTLNAVVAQNDTLKNGTSQLNTALEGVAKGITGIDTCVKQLNPYNETLLSAAASLSDEKTVSALTSGVTALSTGAQSLSTGAAGLQKGLKGLNQATKQVGTGIGQLATGSSALTTGLNTFKSEGTGKLQTEYDSKVKTVLKRFQSLTGNKASYKSFTGIADNTDGSVKFIFQTESIKQED